MNKILLLVFLSLTSIVFGQDTKNSKHLYFELKKISDSIGVPTPPEISELMIDINIARDFKDQLLINNNYKNPVIRNSIVNEFAPHLPSGKDYKTIALKEQKIIEFYQIVEIMKYGEAYRLLGNNLKSHLSKDIRKLENELIQILRKGNYPVEKFNKINKSEQIDVLNKIEGGYVYP